MALSGFISLLQALKEEMDMVATTMTDEHWEQLGDDDLMMMFRVQASNLASPTLGRSAMFQSC